ncbi:YdeI/OmpD-associated family protein [Candidatus Micrarchaeota archaeon]|nr:YdeI/OmpD-associated family protein [Candidatus Micrarchaeota archaeon]
MKKALDSNKKALENFNNLAYTYRKEYILWIEDAKRQETHEKRLKQAIRDLINGKKLNEEYM